MLLHQELLLQKAHIGFLDQVGGIDPSDFVIEVEGLFGWQGVLPQKLRFVGVDLDQEGAAGPVVRFSTFFSFALHFEECFS